MSAAAGRHLVASSLTESSAEQVTAPAPTKSHRAAAEHHGKGDHTKGKEHSMTAQQHAENAAKYSDQAHSKSQQQK
jgi:hypothetical protein